MDQRTEKPEDSAESAIGWWWKATGPHLSALLTEAGYTNDAKAKALHFLQHFVVPNLGPRPSSTRPFWKSFMTDDFTPIEYSWKWSHGDASPEIRYSIEAISRSTGTESDPMNQIATVDLLDELINVMPNLDYTLFQHFLPRLVGPDTPAGRCSIDSSRTSLFLAFECNHTRDIAVKIYFVPAATSQLTVGAQIMDAIKSFGYANLAPIKGLEAFLTSDWAGKNINPIMLGIDCVKPCESRLKIYARSTVTSFRFVQHTMSLGGIRAPQGLEEHKLKELWYRVLGLPSDFPVDQELPLRKHTTAGILFYFDVGPKGTMPDVKVYIPVRHYGQNDFQIARDLIEFQVEHGCGKHAEGYLRAIEHLATPRGLGSGKGVHTYVTAAYKGDNLTITSYLNPQFYHAERW